MQEACDPRAAARLSGLYRICVCVCIPNPAAQWQRLCTVHTQFSFPQIRPHSEPTLSWSKSHPDKKAPAQDEVSSQLGLWHTHNGEKTAHPSPPQQPPHSAWPQHTLLLEPANWNLHVIASWHAEICNVSSNFKSSRVNSPWGKEKTGGGGGV